MAEGLISRWNTRVSTEALVYVLGDFGFGSMGGLSSILGRLHGTKVLLMGNHDRHSRGAYLKMGFSEVLGKSRAEKVVLRDIPGLGEVYLSHYPPREARDRISLCGHVHQNWKVRKDLMTINVGIDVWDFMPVPTSDLLAKILSDLRPMTEEEREEQRRSFVYGQTRMSNPEVTPELVEEVASVETSYPMDGIKVLPTHEAIRKRHHLYVGGLQDLVSRFIKGDWESVLVDADGQGVTICTTQRSRPVEGSSLPIERLFMEVSAGGGTWEGVVFAALSETLEVEAASEGRNLRWVFKRGIKVSGPEDCGPVPLDGRKFKVHMRPDPTIFGDFRISPEDYVDLLV